MTQIPIRSISNSQLHKRQGYAGSKAVQCRLERAHLRRGLAFPDHLLAHHTDGSYGSMRRGQANRCNALQCSQATPVILTATR